MLIQEFDCRADIVLATKAVQRPDTERRLDASRGLVSALDASLKRWTSPTLICGNCIAGTPGHRSKRRCPPSTRTAIGKARYVGISNYSGWQTARACTLQESRGVAPFSRPRWSTPARAGNRARDRPRGPVAGNRHFAVVSPRPRVLTSKYRHSSYRFSRRESGHQWVRQRLQQRTLPSHRGRGLHRRRGPRCCTGEVALAWLRDRPGVVAPSWVRARRNS